jgi:hypothetical protein
MALDQSTIGKVVTAQMQALERDYDDDQDHQIGAVITIVEILTPEGEGFRSEVRTRNNVVEPYKTLGLMKIAEQSVLKALGEN